MFARRSFIAFAAANTLLAAGVEGASAAPITAALDMSVAPEGTAAANVTTLQSAVDAASVAGAPLAVRGAFSIDGQINVPSDSDIDFTRAVVMQTADLTPVLVIEDATNVRIRNLRV